MKISICEKCKHFMQHYISSKMLGISKVNCGHCRKKLMKQKDCGSFEENFENNKPLLTIFHYANLYERNLIQLSTKLSNLSNEIKSLQEQLKDFK